MSERHIAEVLQDVLSSERSVAKALESVDGDIAHHIEMARNEEMKRAHKYLSDCFYALNRLFVIAERAPQKKPPR